VVTIATPTMQNWSARWDAAIRSAVPSGIVGDYAHTLAPGKHISWQDNRNKFGAGVWPIVGGGDGNPKNKSASAAIDMSMNRADQNAVHNRYIAVFNDRNNDPRAQYVAAINGWNGSGSPMRYQFYDGGKAVTDRSHEWHEHVEVYYDQVDDPKMVDANMSIITGESKAAYIGRTVKNDMALELTTLLGGNTGHAGRNVADLYRDLSNLRNWTVTKMGTPGQAWVPEVGSPIRQLEEVPGILTKLAVIQASMAQMAGKDFVDEDAVVKGVLAGLGRRPVAEIAAALKAVMDEEGLAELRSAL
jgi:hypothetical protein